MRWFLLLGLVAGCATPAPTVTPEKKTFRVHVGESWYAYRGSQLGLTQAEARERDLEIGELGPPKDHFWDKQLATESAALWRSLCNECHRGIRSVAAAATIPPPAADWGRSNGRFFERYRRHQKIFTTIFAGGKEREDPRVVRMPSWGSELSREQIWGLVYWLEHQSSRDTPDSK